MEVLIQIRDDKGAVLTEHRASATHPTQFKCPYNKPFEDENYNLFGFVYQPLVQIKKASFPETTRVDGDTSRPPGALLVSSLNKPS